MSTDERRSVRLSYRFDQSRERVFDAWFDPGTAWRWLFATPAGRVVAIAMEPRIGGNFMVVDHRDGGDVAHYGVYRELERPHRIVFDLSVPKIDKDWRRVAIMIEPAGAGCVLTLVHDGIAAGQVAQIEAGWRAVLESLSAVLAVPRATDTRRCG